MTVRMRCFFSLLAMSQPHLTTKMPYSSPRERSSPAAPALIPPALEVVMFRVTSRIGLSGWAGLV